MIKNCIYIFFVLVSIILVLPCYAATMPNNGGKLVSLKKVNISFDVLKSGIGFGEIFRYPDSTSGDYFRNYFKKNDLLLLQKLGVKHIRLAIHPGYFSSNMQKNFLIYIDAFVKTMLDNNIAVIIDIHPQGDSTEFETNTGKQYLNTLWDVLSKHYAKYPPNKIIFEILNEPVFENKDAEWDALQMKVYKTIRANAPTNIIILNGASWGSMDGLKKLTIVKDKNVVYSFHFYEPMLFTHQGADRIQYFGQLKNKVVYPITSGNCINLMNIFPYDSQGRWTIKRYCENNALNYAQISAKFADIVSWANTNKVKLYLGEFGVDTDYTINDSKLQWYKDIKSLIDKYGLLWSVWGYSQSFGLGVQKDSNYNITSYDLDVAKILFGIK